MSVISVCNLVSCDFLLCGASLNTSATAPRACGPAPNVPTYITCSKTPPRIPLLMYTLHRTCLIKLHNNYSKPAFARDFVRVYFNYLFLLLTQIILNCNLETNITKSDVGKGCRFGEYYVILKLKETRKLKLNKNTFIH